jgi:DNA-binding NarL/FixJ family response regulator
VVGTAENGQEALRLANDLQPDVILMDLNMPEIDGLEATRLILRNLPQTQVLMLTNSFEQAMLSEVLWRLVRLVIYLKIWKRTVFVGRLNQPLAANFCFHHR